jgi:hypothetical protein
VAEAGDSSVIATEEVFDMRNLSVRSNERGKRLRGIIDWERIERTVIEGSGRRHGVSSVVVRRRSSVAFRRQGILKDSCPRGGLYRRRNCISSRVGQTILENANPARLNLQKAMIKKRCRGSVSSYFTDDDVSCTS